jgi:serine/threonine protein kinase
MDRSAMRAIPTDDELIFRDGLGDRLLVRDAKGRPVHETLALRTELVTVPSFEFMVNQRVALLQGFRDPRFVPVRQLIRVPGPVPCVSVASDFVPGARLSDVLANCEKTLRLLTAGTVLFFTKQILESMSVLHRQSGDVAHGALSPERLLIADDKPLVTDYVLGSALEQLHYSPDRYWKDLRVAVPPSAGGVRFDRRVDVAQIAMIAVALFTSRPLGDQESIGHLGDLIMGLRQLTSDGPKPLALPLRSWLLKALHMDMRRTFATVAEASKALDEAMAEAGVQPTPSEPDLTIMRPRRAGVGLWVAPPVTRTIPVVEPPAAQKPPKKRRLRKQAQKEMQDTPTVDSGAYGDYAVPPPLPRGSREAVESRKNILKFGLYATIVAAVFTAAQFIPAPTKLFSTTGTLVLDSKPQGVQILIDGEAQGITPLTLKLKAGRHEVELRHGKSRVFNVYVTKGDSVSQYIEFPAPVRVRKPAAATP